MKILVVPNKDIDKAQEYLLKSGYWWRNKLKNEFINLDLAFSHSDNYYINITNSEIAYGHYDFYKLNKCEFINFNIYLRKNKLKKLL